MTVKNLDVGVPGIIKKAALGRGGARERIIYKIVNFVRISQSIQNNFLINSATAYSLADVCLFKPDKFQLSTSFPKI